MTTNVTVVTHDWPVQITQTDEYADEIHQEKIRVEPNTTKTFYLTNTRTLHFKELPSENQ